MLTCCSALTDKELPKPPVVIFPGILLQRNEDNLAARIHAALLALEASGVLCELVMCLLFRKEREMGEGVKLLLRKPFCRRTRPRRRNTF